MQPQLAFSITSTIKDIPKAYWDNLFGQSLIESYGYQKTLEEANLKEFSLGYLLAKRQEKLVAIIPFFSMAFPLAAMTGGLLPWLKIKILFLGSPTAEEFYLGISESEDLNPILSGAVEHLKKFCRRQKIKLIAFNNVTAKNTALMECLSGNNFIKMETLPTTIIEINANSLEDYIKQLSPNARKDLNRKLKKSAALTQLKTQEYENIRDIKEKIYSLYMNNFDGSSVRFETLTPEFFENICKNMPDTAKFFVTYDKDKIVAFNLCLMKDRLFIDKFIGFDSAVAHDYHLYFTTFCHNLNWCIKNGFKYYQPGTTDYYPKVRLGAKLIPLYVYVNALNPLLQALIKLIAPLIEPKKLDPSLRNIEKLQNKN